MLAILFYFYVVGGILGYFEVLLGTSPSPFILCCSAPLYIRRCSNFGIFTQPIAMLVISYPMLAIVSLYKPLLAINSHSILRLGSLMYFRVLCTFKYFKALWGTSRYFSLSFHIHVPSFPHPLPRLPLTFSLRHNLPAVLKICI